MDSIAHISSESSEFPQSPLAPGLFPMSSCPTLDPTMITSESKKKAKSYGSLTTEQLSHVKSFIKKAIKNDKADRLERKELDKVAIAKMRLGVDVYDEMLSTIQKASDLKKPISDAWRDVHGCDEDGEEVSREELDIVSLRRQLANMRKRS